MPLLFKEVLYNLLWIFWVLLIARLVLSYVVMVAREWRPKGVVLVLVEAIYTVTDPPLKALRKVLPPIRLGPIALDTAFMVLFFAVVIAMQVVVAA